MAAMINLMDDLQDGSGHQPPGRGSGRASQEAQGLLQLASSAQAPSTVVTDSFQAMGSALADFFAQVDAIRDGPLTTFERMLDDSKALYKEVIDATSRESQRFQKVTQLEEKASRTASSIKLAISNLAEKFNQPSSNDEAVLKKQTYAALTNRFKEALHARCQAHQEFKKQRDEKVCRQLRNQFPHADAAYIQELADGAPGGADQILRDATSMAQGTQEADVRLAIRAQEQRLNDMEQLSEATTQLMQCFRDMETLVVSQGEAIAQIQKDVETTEARTGTAVTELARTVRNNNRRRKCVCFCIVFLIIVGVAVGLWIWQVQPFGKKKKSQLRLEFLHVAPAGPVPILDLRPMLPAEASPDQADWLATLEQAKAPSNMMSSQF